MPKLYLALLSSVVAFGIVGCTKEIKMPTAAAPSCSFPDAPGSAAPEWVCDAPVEGYPVSAAGSAEKTGAGIAFQKEMGATAARVQLAQQLKVHVANMVKQYVETTGAGASETVDKAMTSVTKQITSATLEGSQIVRTQASPNGVLYVLVGMNPQLVEKKVKESVKTSMNNERALWQQFKAKQGQDEMAAEIAKQAATTTQGASQ